MISPQRLPPVTTHAGFFQLAVDVLVYAFRMPRDWPRLPEPATPLAVKPTAWPAPPGRGQPVARW